MSAYLQMLDEELADTLERESRRPNRKRKHAPMTASRVPVPRPPTVGVCSFCGTVAPQRTVCVAHEDLPELDGRSSAVVTRNTSGAGRSSLDGSSAAGARLDDRR